MLFFSHLFRDFATSACERPRICDVFAPFVLTRCNRPLSNLGRLFGEYETHFPGCSPRICQPRLGSATPGLAGLWPRSATLSHCPSVLADSTLEHSKMGFYHSVQPCDVGAPTPSHSVEQVIGA